MYAYAFKSMLNINLTCLGVWAGWKDVKGDRHLGKYGGRLLTVDRVLDPAVDDEQSAGTDMDGEI